MVEEEDCIEGIFGNMKKSNKKIRNATICKDSNVTFKSVLEKRLYKTLLELGFNPKYEPRTFIVWEGFTSVTPFYDKETDSQRDKRDPKSSKILVEKSYVVQPIRYTPDIYFEYNGIDVWIEAKGIENDVFYIKKKLFRKYLDDLYLKEGKKSMYFEIYTEKHLAQALEIIKNMENHESCREN